MWINTNTSDLVVYSLMYEIRQAFPDVSFPEIATNEDFKTVGVYPVSLIRPPEHDPITQNVVYDIQQVDTVWTQVWNIVPASDEEVTQRETAAKKENKAEAMLLLQETDWTEGNSVRDATKPIYLVNGEEWDNYRVALRTIAINPPVTIEDWPIKPEEQWSNV